MTPGAPSRPMTRPRLAWALVLVACLPALAGCLAPGARLDPAPTCRPEARTWLADAATAWPAPPPALEEERLPGVAPSPEARAAAARWNVTAPTTLWTEELLTFIPAHVTNLGKGNVPRLARSMAILEIGMHDALAVARAAQACYARASPDGASARSYPDAHAAVAGAAGLLLSAAVPNETARFQALAVEAAQARSTLGAAWPSDVEAGFALGEAVARAVLLARAGDGLDLPNDRAPPQSPCTWERAPPAFDGPLEPRFGEVRPFLLPRGDALRPPPPPACGSDEARAQVRAIYEASFNLTDAQRAAALDWAGGRGTPSPPGIWLWLALNETRERDLSAEETARVMSHVAAALADAGIVAWDAKYAYWSERPLTAIRRDFDPEWSPLVETPPFPGYVSGHSTFSAASATILGHYFPDEASRFDALAHEAMMSRFWGGIHVMADNEQGFATGNAVGAAAVAHDVAWTPSGQP